MSPDLIRMPVFADRRRGSLSVLEFDRDLPFQVRRQFIVYGVPEGGIRGQHANRQLKEVLICVRGSMTVTLDDAVHRTSVTLDDPSVGLYLPNMIWSEQLQYSPDAVVVVLASLPYDAADAITDYDTFVSLKQRRPAIRVA